MRGYSEGPMRFEEAMGYVVDFLVIRRFYFDGVVPFRNEDYYWGY